MHSYVFAVGRLYGYADRSDELNARYVDTASYSHPRDTRLREDVAQFIDFTIYLDDQSFASAPFDPRKVTWLRVMSFKVRHPANAIVCFSSWWRIFSANSTPACPLYCNFDC